MPPAHLPHHEGRSVPDLSHDWPGDKETGMGELLPTGPWRKKQHLPNTWFVPSAALDAFYTCSLILIRPYEADV